jgi:hypothetical protein
MQMNIIWSVQAGNRSTQLNSNIELGGYAEKLGVCGLSALLFHYMCMEVRMKLSLCLIN